MTAVNQSGEQIEVDNPNPPGPGDDPLASASLPELRGVFARMLIKKGHKPKVVAKAARSSVRQMYRDIESAEGILSQICGGALV